MTGLAASAALVWAMGCSGWADGYATHYRAGLFEEVAHNRDMPIASCMVADDVAELGAFITIRGVRTGAIRRCQVTDMSAGRATTPGSDKWRHLHDGLVELDYDSALAICGKWFRERWRNCPIRIWRG